MKNWFGLYISKEYLLSTVSGSKFESYYLYLSILLITVVFLLRIYLFIKKGRAPIYKKFDSYFFWGFLSFGLAGLFIWFSRTQGLPIFSTRAFSYLWALAFGAYAGFLAYYYKRIIPEKLNKFYETKRKSKYLRR